MKIKQEDSETNLTPRKVCLYGILKKVGTNEPQKVAGSKSQPLTGLIYAGRLVKEMP